MDLLNGNIRKIYNKYLIPAIGGTLVIAAYSFVDTIAIGQGVGPNGAAACALTTIIFGLATFLGLLPGMGGAVLMSEAKGSGEIRKANSYFTASCIVLAVLTIPVWLGCIFYQEEIYRLFGCNDEVMPYVIDYNTIVCITLPSFIICNFLTCFIRNDGAPNLVLWASIVGAIVNIVGDWLFVFPMQMGMFGAALATVLGSLIQLVMMVGYFFTKRCSIRFKRVQNLIDSAGKIIVNGFGAGFTQITILIFMFVINNQIMKYSGVAMLALYGIINSIASLYANVFCGVGQAVQPIASINYGAGNRDRCWEVYRLGFRTTVILGVIFSALGLFFPVQTIQFFTKTTPEMLELAPFVVRTYCASFLFLGLNIYLSVYFQSVLEARKSTVIGILRGVVVNCTFIYLFPLFWGADGIWIAIPAAETLVLALVSCQQ